MTCDIFLSYADPKDLFGTVSEFRCHLENQVQQKTGKKLTVFQDKRDIHGGKEWANVLSNELISAKLLIILLSPLWLNSPWCRKEYTIFCESHSRPRKIFPLRWTEILDRHIEGSEADAIFSELKTYQIRDWTKFAEAADWRSPSPNIAVGGLAKEIDLLLAS
jgi:hypothetical protein